MSLNDYFQKHIFQPLGITNISMFPNDDMKSRLAHMHARAPDGTLREREHLLRRPLIVDGDDIGRTYNSAGAGCFAQPSEYCSKHSHPLANPPPSPTPYAHPRHTKTNLNPAATAPELLATLLNDGLSPTTNKRILQAQTVQQMFTNQIPQFPDFGRNPIPAVKPELTNPIPELYPQPPEQPQGWGLTFMLTLHPGATGRGKSTGWWAGLPNLFWWCDREGGVAGIIASQILPFAGESLFFPGGGGKGKVRMSCRVVE